jgi:hypothetical protein
MAKFGTIDVDVRLTGDLEPVVKAFGIMSAALAAYGHEFSDADEVTIGDAAECLHRAYEQALQPDEASS